MSKSETLALLSRTPYAMKEDRVWAAENKPYSVWYLTVREGQPLAQSVRGGVKFKGEKLDGAMVSWSASSATQSEVAANLTNLLERFSTQGFTSCKLSVAANARPPQEDTDATFQCGLRGLRIEHIRFNALFQGEKLPDSAAIYEMLGNWY